MANPQLEDGFLRIANEIVEAMGHLILNSEESRCLWVLFRLTYGYSKKSDKIGLSQFAESTDMTRGNVCRALTSLKNRQIITVTPGYRNQYAFQKDHALWTNERARGDKHVTQTDNVIQSDNVIQTDKHLLSKRIMNVIQTDNKVLSTSIALQRQKTISKENSKDITAKPQKEVKAISEKLPKLPDEDAYTYALTIAQAAGYEGGYPNKAEACRYAKDAIKQNILCDELADCVRWVFAVNGQFWADKTLSIPSAIRQLPAYQKAIKNGWKPGQKGNGNGQYRQQGSKPEYNDGDNPFADSEQFMGAGARIGSQQG